MCARLGAEWALWGPAVLIARPAAGGGRACAVADRCDRLYLSRAFAAGRTFSHRTLKAEWAARAGHTSVVDAVSGAIYVIGGLGSTTYYNDVWVSTDGGARPDTVGGAVGGYTGGVLRGTKGVLRVLQGYCRGTAGVLRGTEGVLRGN